MENKHEIVKSVNLGPEAFEIENGKYYLMKYTAPGMSNDELAEFSARQKEEGNPYAIGLPAFIENFALPAINSKNNDFLNFLSSKIKNHPQFLSRAIYSNDCSENGAFHEYKMPEEYFVPGNIYGKSGLMEEIDNPTALEILTGLKGIKELSKLNEFSRKICEKEGSTYLGRENSKPYRRIERAVRLFSGVDGLDLSANRGLSDEVPAFLVLPKEK